MRSASRCQEKSISHRQGKFTDRQKLAEGEKYYLNSTRDLNMLVPDAIRKTVIFLGEDSPEGKRWKAPAYLISVPGGHGLEKIASIAHLTETIRYRTTFIVTTRHAAEKLEGKRFHVRANKRNGGMATVKCGPDTKWWYHPHDKRYVDAAATRFWPDELPDLDVEAISLEMFIDDQIIMDNKLGVGDEVFITGLFTPTAETTRSVPIVRKGIVAMIPGEDLPFNDGLLEAHLIECGSVDGLGGSPVFVRETLQVEAAIHFKPDRNFAKVADSRPSESFNLQFLQDVGRFYFFGSIMECWDLQDFSTVHPETPNMGISAVVPASKIKELILQDGIVDLMKARTAELQKINEALATYD
jgi:hypothetical protein